jgi:hypothetical protein
MSIKPMRQSTNLTEQINETLEFIYLTQDEHYGLETAVKYFLENCDEIDRDYQKMN